MMASVAHVQHPFRSYPLVLTALVAADATAAFEAAMLTSAVPKLIAEFDLRTTDAGWVFTCFTLMGAASAAIGGKLGDLFGRKKVLVVILLLSVAGSVVSAGVGTFPAILAGRTVQGVSGAVLPLVTGIAREAVEPRRVPVTIAVVAGTATPAGGAGYFISGVLTQAATWQAIFLAAAALGALATVLCQFCLSTSAVAKPGRGKIDVVGAVLFVPAVLLILYGVTTAQTRGGAHPVVLGTICAGLFLCLFWVWRELRVPNPMLDLRLLAIPGYALTVGIVAFLALGAIGGMQLVQPLLFQSPTSAPVGLGMSPSQFGATALGVAAFGFLFAPVSGVVARRVGARRSMLLGMAILTVTVPGHFLLRESLPLMISILALTSVGVTFALTAVPNLLAEVLPEENMSEGMGFIVTIRSLFQGASVSIFAVALSSSVVPGTRFPQVGAYGLAIGAGTAGILAGLVPAFLARARPSAPTRSGARRASRHS